MRINEKIAELEKYLGELSEIIPERFEDYAPDFKTKAACERYSEKIIEAVIDLAFLVIKSKGLKIPEEDKKVFDILADDGVITEELAAKLKEAKGMRNILAHEYGKVDDKIIFDAITNELKKDANDFILCIKKVNL